MTDGPSDHATALPDDRHHPVALVPWVLAVLFYAALTVVQTWPLVTRLSTVLPHDVGDPVLGSWIIWWNAHTVPLTARWWNPPIFWPVPGAFAFSETLLGLSPITGPIQWLGGSPVTAYNIAFLLTFLLSAVAAHALVFDLTGRHDAALIGGLVYGFNPYRVAQIPHIQVIASFWMPIALLALHRYLTNRKARWLWIFGAAWLLQALSNGYYLFFFPVLLALWMIWFARSRMTRRPLALMVGTWIVWSLPLVPLLWEYRQVHAANDFGRSFSEIEFFSADAAGFLFASPMLKFWTLHVFPGPEGELFPGFMAPIIVVLLIAHWLGRSGRVTRMSRSCLVLLVASLTFSIIALSAVLFGPWSITVGGLRLIAVQVVSKPVSIAVLLFAAALGFEPRVADLWRRRSPLLFYVLATAAMFLLSLGPVPRFLGAPFLYRSPYGWLLALPGYDAVRVPARFAMLAVLCLAVAAALAFARLTFNVRPFMRWGFAALAISGVLIDSWIGELPLPQAPVRLQALESGPDGTAVIELPLGEVMDDAAAMYRGLYHRRPVVNGYGGHYPRYYELLRYELAEHDDRSLDALTALGPLTVVVNEERDGGGEWAMHLAAYRRAVALGEESGRKLFRLAGGKPAPSIAGLRPLPVQSVSANVERDRIALVLDGDSRTGWDSGGPQRGTEVVTVDLGSRRTVDALTMTIGEHLGDFPRLLAIESSEDGSEWSPQGTESTGALALAGALRDPHEVPLTIALPHISARLLRLRQLAKEPRHLWTILELKVWGQ